MKLNNKTINNAVWIIVCRILQAVLNVLVTMLTARFYGPANYGLLNYAASIVAFAAPLMKLGFTTTLVQEFVDRQEEEGKILGTALAMNMASALLSMVGVVAFVAIANPGERSTWIVCVLYSLNLPFQALEMSQYWFQAKLKSKYTSIVMLAAYGIVSTYKIFLIASGKTIYWFAVSQALDYCIISVALLVIYHTIGGQRLTFSRQRGAEMFAKSKYYIISSLMITIFAQTDKVMLKNMLGDVVTGYYSAAVTCAGMTSFVFSAIIDSAKPTILQAKQRSQQAFSHGMIVLYSVVLWLAILQSVVITLFAEWIIRILYGVEYLQSVGVLRVIVWYTTFSYLGSARTVWVLGEQKHSLLWSVNLYGALANVMLNALLIPVWGAMGAAMASLVTQMFTNVLVGFVIPALRENTMLMFKALNISCLLDEAKRLLGRKK